MQDPINPGEESARVLAFYETMALKSSAMLTAARSDDWDEVARLERDCAAIIAELKAGADAVRLSEHDRERKLACMKRMLEDDAAIRDLAQPWLANLQNLIRSTATQRKLGRAYG